MQMLPLELCKPVLLEKTIIPQPLLEPLSSHLPWRHVRNMHDCMQNDAGHDCDYVELMFYVLHNLGGDVVYKFLVPMPVETVGATAGEEKMLNVAFVIPRSFDSEVLLDGTVVGAPAGETLKCSIAQGLNVDRRLEVTCQAPQQQMPVMTRENSFDPTAEMQGKQKHVSNNVTNYKPWSCLFVRGWKQPKQWQLCCRNAWRRHKT